MAGRRPAKALTAALARIVKEPGKYFGGHGLYLRVEPNSSRFRVQRIAIRGKRTELGLGSPALVTLAEVREAALANRKLARSGGGPWIGGLRMTEVRSADVLDVLTPLWGEKVDMARRVRQRIGMVMKRGIAKVWRLDNPAENILKVLPKQNGGKQSRKAMPYVEVADFLSAVRASEAGRTARRCTRHSSPGCSRRSTAAAAHRRSWRRRWPAPEDPFPTPSVPNRHPTPSCG